MNIQKIQLTNFKANKEIGNNLVKDFANIVKAHPTAKIYITEHESAPFSVIRNSIRAGHPARRNPDFTISINDYIIKSGDSYISDRANPSRNAAVDGNIYISDKNAKGSTLVAVNYPIYKGAVNIKDVEKAMNMYDRLIKKTLKLLK